MQGKTKALLPWEHGQGTATLATLTRGTGTGAGGGWTAAALGTGPGAQGELLAVLKSSSCFPHTD